MAIRLLPRRLMGQTIRGIRTRLGMTPAEFARSLGVDDVAQVGRWERGTVQPEYGTLAKIATMGVVDVLVFHEPAAEGSGPQLTPGEATALADILVRMEALLTEARKLVQRAENRTALEMLEAASGPAPADLEGASLVLDAGVRVEAGPRAAGRSRTASAGRRATGSTSRPRTGGASKSGGSASGSSGSRSSGGTSSTTGSRASSGGAGRSSTSRSGNGSSRAGTSRTRSSQAGGTASSGDTSSGGTSANRGSSAASRETTGASA